MTRVNAWLHLLSLSATAWFVWVNSVAPRIGRESLGSVASEALFHLFTAAAAAVLIALCAYATVSRGGTQGRIRDPMSAVAVAVWYAPAMFLAASFTPVSMGASLILVVSATRLLAIRWMADAAPESRAFTSSRVLIWRVMFAGAASAAIHGGIFAFAAGLRFPAAVLFGASAAILTSLAVVTGAFAPRRDVKLPHAVLGLVLTLLLAAGITVVRYGGGSVVAEGDPMADFTLPDGGFPGVILDPRTRASQPRIEPPDTAFSRRPADPRDPISIPFTGEYWLYQLPFSRPPEQSAHRDGTPLELWFSTLDRRPLAMEARQRLEEALNTDCCGGIEVTFVSQDVVPGTATVELQLLNSRSVFFRLPLGERPIRGAGRESVSFAMPDSLRRSRFDSLRLVFHPPPSRASRSMRIQVERFVLAPRVRNGLY